LHGSRRAEYQRERDRLKVARDPHLRQACPEHKGKEEGERERERERERGRERESKREQRRDASCRSAPLRYALLRASANRYTRPRHARDYSERVSERVEEGQSERRVSRCYFIPTLFSDGRERARPRDERENGGSSGEEGKRQGSPGN